MSDSEATITCDCAVLLDLMSTTIIVLIIITHGSVMANESYRHRVSITQLNESTSHSHSATTSNLWYTFDDITIVERVSRIVDAIIP